MARWRKANRTRDRELKRRYRAKNRQLLAAKLREWRESNRDKTAAWAHKNYAANSTELRTRQRVRSARERLELRDVYVAKALGLSSVASVPPVLLEAKRAQLQIYRLAKRKS